jgi:iron(III) transport system substrate-binding protein
MARPLTGTTLTHVAALYAARGPEWTDSFLDRAEASGLAFVQSNGQVMRLVREGQMAFGLTDTDDARVALAGGYPVAQVYPDQADADHRDARGTLLIPNTVAILAGAPHPENARKLVDYILSEEVEAALAASDSAQIPVRKDVPRPAHVRSGAELTLLDVDWRAVAGEIERRLPALTERFLR